MRGIFSASCLLLSCLLANLARADEAGRMWAALEEGGKVIIMRHALAPGPQQGREGDPPGFRLDDCATQRNLSSAGRRQATELGNMLRAHRVVITRALSSPWCRARDTAALMLPGATIEDSELLHNYGEENTGGGAGSAAKAMLSRKKAAPEVWAMIGSWMGPGNLLLVTHGRTVVRVVWADGRVSPEQGTLIVLQPMNGADPPFREIGTIRAPDSR